MAWGHIGSWGTPDFGITEKIGSLLGYGTNAQGGSNLSTPWTAPAELTAQQNLAQNMTPNVNIVQPSGTGGTGGTGGSQPVEGGQQPSGPSPEELYMQMLEGEYAKQDQNINDMMGGLDPQKAAMEQQAQNTYNQNAGTLDTTYNSNVGDLNDYQTKTLQDIGTALQNMWQQGGRMLGTRGAADSSAAGMFNYAVGKLGSKQRGDVMQDVSKRLGTLKSYYDTNKSNLKLELDNQIQQVSQWYNEALNSIRGMKGQLQQQKSQDALNVAINMLNDARSQAYSRQNILDQWAAAKAQSLPQLQTMLNANSAGLQPYQGLGANVQFTGTPQSTQMFGFGNTGQDTLNWLQNLIPTK